VLLAAPLTLLEPARTDGMPTVVASLRMDSLPSFAEVIIPRGGSSELQVRDLPHSLGGLRLQQLLVAIVVESHFAEEIAG
jgi:hypothetical protein